MAHVFSLDALRLPPLSAYLRPMAAGIQPGAPSHQRRRAAAEQMRRRRDRIVLQRKEATAEAAAAAAEAANDGDASAEQERQRHVAKARASAIVDAALAAGEKDGDAILGMIDGRVVTEVDVDIGERTPAAKGSTKDGALGAEDESLRVSRAVSLFRHACVFKHQKHRTHMHVCVCVCVWSTLVAWHGSRLGGRSDVGLRVLYQCAFVLHDGCPFLKSIDRSVDL